MPLLGAPPWAVGLAAALALGACTHVAGALPEDGATPRQVLDAYLLALQAGDCATTHAYAVDRFLTDGELCGHVNVLSYRSDAYTSQPSADQVELAGHAHHQGWRPEPSGRRPPVVLHAAPPADRRVAAQRRWVRTVSRPSHCPESVEVSRDRR